MQIRPPDQRSEGRLRVICHRNRVYKLAELRRLHGNSDGLGAWPLGTTSGLVFHDLTLTEFFDSRSLDRRMMEEQVIPPLVLNEPKTSIRNQPLDFTLWHFCSPM